MGPDCFPGGSNGMEEEGGKLEGGDKEMKATRMGPDWF